MYVYGTRMRPPDIGCVPKTGLVEVNPEEFEAVGTHYWGTAFYSRKLTEEELKHYDMDLLRETFIDGKRD